MAGRSVQYAVSSKGQQGFPSTVTVDTAAHTKLKLCPKEGQLLPFAKKMFRCLARQSRTLHPLLPASPLDFSFSGCGLACPSRHCSEYGAQSRAWASRPGGRCAESRGPVHSRGAHHLSTVKLKVRLASTAAGLCLFRVSSSIKTLDCVHPGFSQPGSSPPSCASVSDLFPPRDF